MTLRGGRYERLRPIASGGMATVYLGRAHGVGVGGFERQVAIKVMHAHLADAPEFVAMFLDEARLAARLRHPNIVSTLDAVRDEQGLFLVMEYVEGLALHRLHKVIMAEGERLSFDVSARIVVDALHGLHFAHELRADDGAPLELVHRDVSPQNIMVSVSGVAAITDFGIARAGSRASQTRTGELKGKVAYMSPEQVRADPIDRRSDVYAAGVILWELLAGRRLFKADSDAALTFMVAAGVQHAPGDESEGVPPALAAACMRAVALDPSRRFADAAEFAEAIEDAAQRDGVGLARPRKVAEVAKRAMALVPSTGPGSSVSHGAQVPLAGAAERAAGPVERTGGTAGPSVVSAEVATAPHAGGNRRWVFVAGSAILVGAVVAVLTLGGAKSPEAPATPLAAPNPAAPEPAAPGPAVAERAEPPPDSPGPPAAPESSAASSPSAPASAAGAPPAVPAVGSSPSLHPNKPPPAGKPPSSEGKSKVPFRAEQL